MRIGIFYLNLLLQVKKYFALLIYFLLYSACAQSIADQKKAIELQISNASKFFQSGDYENALKLSQNALIASLKIDDDFLIAHSYNSIGVIYNELSNSSRAIEFYKKALFHAEKTNNDKLKNWIYGNLGSFYYYDDNQALKGIIYYKKSLALAEKIKDIAQINFTKLNIAAAYFSINDFKSGIVYINQIKNYVINNRILINRALSVSILRHYY